MTFVCFQIYTGRLKYSMNIADKHKGIHYVISFKISDKCTYWLLFNCMTRTYISGETDVNTA